MNLSRREFLQILAAASAAGMSLAGCDTKSKGSATTSANDPYDIKPFGQVSFLHMTDCHAQLLPIYFREPHINIGIGGATGKPPHLVGEHLLKAFNIATDTADAHAFTYLNFEEASRKYGKVGGFAHLATLVKKMRAQRPNSLLLDGGDTWQGSATALWTKGQDMVDACKLLGVDIMTGHWEFTYGAERVKDLIKQMEGSIEFVAQNVVDNTFEEPIFKPYTIREMNGVKVAVIGQAFPYTPIANPRYMIPDWSFGIRDGRMQEMVDEARGNGAQVVVVVSHNGMDVDLKMASRVNGIDAILGGHTHDGVPAPQVIPTPDGGKTLVINSGSNGKFLSVLDIEVKDGKVSDYRFKLLPVFSNLLEADKDMQALIDKVRSPFKQDLEESLAITESLLYRRGNFNGSFDQLILDAMLKVQDAEIALSPGFRWGTSLLPGDTITRERLMDQTAITYGTSTLNHMKGEMLKVVLEDIADNLFHEDPYYQMGGDMVRIGGLKYSIDPTAKMGNRIGDLELNGKPIDPSKTYKVAGWASMEQQPEGNPKIWDTVSEFLLDKKTVRIDEINLPKIKGMDNNPGFVRIS
ncbi:MAG: thiosulfohydrolase SoxB [Gammaproteobacteria bacterium]|nr:thiosulfohydrolase SoxB [Gammaproteobacteria bacterium]